MCTIAGALRRYLQEQGEPVDNLSLRVGVSILSYAGEVRLGVLTDEGLVPHPEAIISAFHTEFNELLARAIPARDGIPAALLVPGMRILRCVLGLPILGCWYHAAQRPGAGTRIPGIDDGGPGDLVVPPLAPIVDGDPHVA